MIILKMKMNVRPESQEAFVGTLKKIMKTALAESGCLGCRLYQDIWNLLTFTLVEEWESFPGLGNLLRRDTLKKTYPILKFLSKPVEVRIGYAPDRAPARPAEDQSPWFRADPKGAEPLSGRRQERGRLFDPFVVPRPTRMYQDHVLASEFPRYPRRGG